MKKRILVRMAVLIVLAAAGFFLLVWWSSPSNIVSLEQVERIGFGMSEEEVLEVLGEPSTDSPELQKVKTGRVSDIKMSVCGPTDLLNVPGPPSSTKEWRMEEDKRLAVGFEKGTVTMIATFKVNEGVFDKIRRWMRH